MFFLSVVLHSEICGSVSNGQTAHGCALLLLSAAPLCSSGAPRWPRAESRQPGLLQTCGTAAQRSDSLPVVGILTCINPVAVDIYGLCELVY